MSMEMFGEEEDDVITLSLVIYFPKKKKKKCDSKITELMGVSFCGVQGIECMIFFSSKTFFFLFQVGLKVDRIYSN